MIGFVIVSHSVALAEAAVELALQMIHGEPPPVRIAAGADGGFGTDAAAIADAIDALDDTDGVVVVTDLGSAVISSELALDLRSSSVPVRISNGPFVEGITAGLVRAATGGGLDDVAQDAATALAAKQPDAPGAPEAPMPTTSVVTSDSAISSDTEPPAAAASAQATLRNPLGLHSRPAALIVKAASAFDAGLTVADETAGSGPASAVSMIGLLALGATTGHVLRITADGPDAAFAVDAVRRLVDDGFGELTSTPAHT